MQVAPAGAFRDKKAVVVIGILAVAGDRLILHHALLDLAADDPVVLGLEHIRTALQEQHPEDVILVGRGIQPFLPEAVSGGVEMTFELGERQLGHEGNPAWLCVVFVSLSVIRLTFIQSLTIEGNLNATLETP